MVDVAAVAILSAWFWGKFVELKLYDAAPAVVDLNTPPPVPLTDT